MAQTRITSGAWRGRVVDSPRGPRVMRPTSALVRKALFDILGDQVDGALLVDLFAGTGAVAFEALSRGATRVVAVERDRELCRLMRGTAERLGAAGLRVIPADVPAWVRSRPPDLARADVVFVDAPYRDDVVLSVLEELGAAPPPLVVCEHHRARLLPDVAGGLRRRREAHYGTTRLTFYRREGPPPEAPPAGDEPR